MKVIPERETLWVWLSKSATVLGKVFEMPVDDKNTVPPSSNHKSKGRQKQKDLLHTDDSTHSDGPVPGLELIDDASLNWDMYEYFFTLHYTCITTWRKRNEFIQYINPMGQKAFSLIEITVIIPSIENTENYCLSFEIAAPLLIRNHLYSWRKNVNKAKPAIFCTQAGTSKRNCSITPKKASDRTMIEFQP